MGAFRNASFLAVSTILLAMDGVQAGAIEDANAAVLAARDGKYEDAIRLFTSAINSDELTIIGRAQAYAYRGIAKATTGDFEGANLDLNLSVALDSGYNDNAYAFRGYFRMVTGQPKEGAADLAKSAELRIWPYNALWLYLARLKGGVADDGEHSLSRNAAILDAQTAQDGSTGLTRWPGAVVKFMMGEGTAQTVRTAANEGDPSKLAERICDVDFYIAERELARGNAAAAKPMLQNAVEKCPFASFERMGATAELARLK
jgi:lipoprotein NlpI